MDTVTIFRFILPFIALGIFTLAVKLIKPPKNIANLALKLCWITAVLNIFADIIGIRFGFWHYTMSHLLYGLPLDLYITISLVYGGALLILYWWIRKFHSKWVLPFVLILPFYGLFRDYFGQKLTSNSFLVWDYSYWWIPDFLSWAIGLWTLLLIFNILLRKIESQKL